jgi:hypothetical protein
MSCEENGDETLPNSIKKKAPKKGEKKRRNKLGKDHKV